MPYHVRLTLFGEPRDEVKLDIDESRLKQQFLEPYRAGTVIVVNGRVVKVTDIKRIRIGYSDVASDELLRRIQDREAARGFISSVQPRWKIAAEADDVTDHFIQGPPGTLAAASEDAPKAPDRRTVFLVHGRNSAITGALRSFLNSLDIRVLEWEQAVSATGKTSPYVGDVIDMGMGLAHAVVVLLTPDDLACLHPDLRATEETPEPLRGQPRPNVIFEAGIAWDRVRERTVLVEVGSVRGFSDLGGVNTVRLNGSAVTRKALVSRLKTAGVQVDDTGDHWLTVGDFSVSMRTPTPEDLGLRPEGVAGAVQQLDSGSDATSDVRLRLLMLSRLADPSPGTTRHEQYS